MEQRISPRMSGKRHMAEELAKQSSAVLVRLDGAFKWDGKRWVKVRETRPLRP